MFFKMTFFLAPERHVKNIKGEQKRSKTYSALFHSGKQNQPNKNPHRNKKEETMEYLILRK